MTRGSAETCRWEKVCKTMLLIKALRKLCLTKFYQYIFWFYETERGILTWKSTLNNIPEKHSYLRCAWYSLMLLRQPKVYTHYAVVTVLRYVRYTTYLVLLK